MYNLPYAYAYALSDMRRITLVLMHILIQHHLHTSLHSHTRHQTMLRLTIQVHMQHSERPLYRVTCGDIGTEVEAAEKYLESILFLGRKWGCGKFSYILSASGLPGISTIQVVNEKKSSNDRILQPCRISAAIQPTSCVEPIDVD